VVELLHVRSSGDSDSTSALARFGRTGVFTVEVDRRVLAGEADAGVHSLKDMTTTLEDGVVLAGTLARGPVEDVLVSRDGATLAELPRGARVATGSLRRAAMLRAERSDLEVVMIRGNVETRLEKLADGAFDALVLAHAGLVRLGLEARISEVLDPRRFVPAVGQGIVGWTARASDDATRRLLAAISDREAWNAALAERAFLRRIHGGCNAPVGAHARASEGALHLAARVLAADGAAEVEGSAHGHAREAETLGERLAEELLAQGAGALIEEARA